MAYGTNGGLARLGEDLHERTQNWKDTVKKATNRILFRDSAEGFVAGQRTILGEHRDTAHAITKKTMDSLRIKESAALSKLKGIVKGKGY